MPDKTSASTREVIVVEICSHEVTRDHLRGHYSVDCVGVELPVGVKPRLCIALMTPRVLQILLLSTLCYWSIAAKGDVKMQAIDSLRTAFAGGMVDEVYFPDHAGYQSASKAFNLRLQYKPAAIAYPRTTEEVAEIVKTCVGLGISGRIIAIPTAHPKLYS